MEWAEGEAAEPAVPVNESVENENEEEEIEFEFKEEGENGRDVLESIDDEEGRSNDAEEEEEEEEGEGEGEGEEEDENELSLLECKCLAFCISLLDHQTEDDSHTNALISGLAVLGIGEEGKEWQSPLVYTPKLSAVVKLARIMVVQSAWQAARDSGDGRVWWR